MPGRRTQADECPAARTPRSRRRASAPRWAPSAATSSACRSTARVRTGPSRAHRTSTGAGRARRQSTRRPAAARSCHKPQRLPRRSGATPARRPALRQQCAPPARAGLRPASTQGHPPRRRLGRPLRLRTRPSSRGARLRPVPRAREPFSPTRADTLDLTPCPPDRRPASHRTSCPHPHHQTHRPRTSPRSSDTPDERELTAHEGTPVADLPARAPDRRPTDPRPARATHQRAPHTTLFGGRRSRAVFPFPPWLLSSGT